MDFPTAKNLYELYVDDDIDSLSAADQRERVADFMHNMAEKFGTDPTITKEQASDYRDSYENLYREAMELKSNTIENGTQKLKDELNMSNMTDDALLKMAQGDPELYNKLYNTPYETDLGDTPLGKRLKQRQQAYAHTNIPDNLGTGLRSAGAWFDVPGVTQAERLAQEGMHLGDTDKMGKLRLAGHAGLNLLEWIPELAETAASKVTGKVAEYAPKIGKYATDAAKGFASNTGRAVTQGAESGLSSSLTSPRNDDTFLGAAGDVVPGAGFSLLMTKAGGLLGRGAIKKNIKNTVKNGNNVWFDQKTNEPLYGGAARQAEFEDALKKKNSTDLYSNIMGPMLEQQYAEQAAPIQNYITQETAKYMQSHGGREPGNAWVQDKFNTLMKSREISDKFAANSELHPDVKLGPQLDEELLEWRNYDNKKMPNINKEMLNSDFETRYGKNWQFDTPAETKALRNQKRKDWLSRWGGTTFIPRAAAKTLAPSETMSGPDYNSWELIPGGYKLLTTASKVPLISSLPVYRDPKKSRTADLKYGLPQWMLNEDQK